MRRKHARNLLATAVAVTFAAPGLHARQELGQCSPQPAPRVNANDGEAFDLFGHSIALRDNTLVVGAWGDITTVLSGSAYVYELRPGGVLFSQKLVAADAAAFDRFGWSVAVEGNTIAIGADMDDIPLVQDAGSVYVYVRSAQTWTFLTRLVAPDSNAGKRFGASVSISGDSLLIGAPGDDEVAQDAGAAYVFVRSGSAWSLQAKLLPSGAGPTALAGISVAIDADQALVGASGYDSTLSNAGAVYPYTRTGSVWNDGELLRAPDPQVEDQYGFSVALRGDQALVGAPLSDVARTDGGAAFAYELVGGTWELDGNPLTADSGNTTDQFGGSVALGEGVALVGGTRDDAAGTNSGGVLLFVRNQDAWQLDQRLAAPDVSSGDAFGFSVAAWQGFAAVGAPQDDPSGNDSGAAYVFDLGCDGAGGVPGDMNCDGTLTVSDIAGFVLALTDPTGYADQFPGCDINNGDISGDNVVTVSDIGPFVALLTGG